MKSRPALLRHLPMTVDAVVSRSELAMPPAVTAEMAKGFTLYMVKAVMSGRGDELVDFARTNLWRYGIGGSDGYHGASPLAVAVCVHRIVWWRGCAAATHCLVPVRKVKPRSGTQLGARLP
jgi:hypothetical protein